MTTSDLRIVRGDDRDTVDAPAERAGAELLLEQWRAATRPSRRHELYTRLVELHLYLVDAIATRYRGRGVDWDDLVQVGRLGLCKAISAFQPDKGSGFVAYAVPTIAGEIKRYFRDTVWAVRPPRRLQELQLELRGYEVHLSQILGHHPSDEELASATGVDESVLREARLAQRLASTVSIDTPGESGRTWADHLATESDDYAALEARLVLRSAIGYLTRRERRIVRLRFELGWTQREIGAALGVSQMQVSRLLAQILTKLRRRILPLEEAG